MDDKVKNIIAYLKTGLKEIKQDFDKNKSNENVYQILCDLGSCDKNNSLVIYSENFIPSEKSKWVYFDMDITNCPGSYIMVNSSYERGSSKNKKNSKRRKIGFRYFKMIFMKITYTKTFLNSSKSGRIGNGTIERAK